MTETWDPVLLARIQFAFTVSFHFIFPSFTIGLASYLAVLEGLWLTTGNDAYMRLFRYWLRIFAVTFAMGVVSGIVMSYQFGSNWSVFSDRAGPVVGPLMAYEVLSAFFLEAGFLGVMLFGLARVGKALHFAATVLVALGTAFSAFWILSVNSWMHTPAGFALQTTTGQFVPLDWWAIVFNPSFPYRFAHTVTAAYLTTALAVGGVGAWHLLRLRAGRRDGDPEAVRIMFSMAMWMAVVAGPTQVLLGDLHGLNTLEHQPVKIMAMEGHFQSHAEGAPLILFGVPDQASQQMRYEVSVPKLSSLILKHDLNAPLAGLDTVARDDQPPVAIVFFAFRVMVGLGLAIVGLGLLALWLRWHGRLYDNAWLHRLAVLMAPAGFVAVIAGWITTEVGRQPWTIHGLMRTSEAVSPVDAPAVAVSLAAFAVVYVLVFGAGIFYLLRLMGQPPQAGKTEGPERGAGIATAPAQAMKSAMERG